MLLSRKIMRNIALGAAAVALGLAGTWPGMKSASRAFAQVPPPLPGDTILPAPGTIFVTVIDASTATISVQGLSPNTTYNVQDCYPTSDNPSECVTGDPAQITTDDAGDATATIVFDGVPGIATIRLTDVNNSADTYTATVAEPLALPDGTVVFTQPPLPQPGD